MTSLFQTLVADGQTDEPVFAFKLAKTGSELFLGGVDNSLFKGLFFRVPVISPVSTSLVRYGLFRIPILM
jgi:hypothetical protein